MWETLAILAAVHHWGRTGEGGHIGLSMLESLGRKEIDALIAAEIIR